MAYDEARQAASMYVKLEVYRTCWRHQVAHAMVSATRKSYAALAVAIFSCVQLVIGYISAIAFPITFFNALGDKYGWFCVFLLKFTIPHFLVSLMLLLLLGFIAESETFRYLFITIVGYGAMMIWQLADDLRSILNAGYADLVLRFAGVCSIVLSGWIAGRRYAAP